MQSKEFYREIDEYIKIAEREEIVSFINNVIRKIPQNKYEEVLCIIDKGKKRNKSEIRKKINEYKKKFEDIEKGELVFYSEEIEDYSGGWDNWITEYYDRDNVGDIIEEAIDFGIELVDYREYSFAKEIFDMVLDTNYQIIDELRGECIDSSLLEIKYNELISINISLFRSYVIYVTYQTSKNRAKDIYSYYQNNKTFKTVSTEGDLENAFKLGSEILTNVDEFYYDWIKILSKSKGRLESILLEEALKYTEFRNYENYTNDLIENHPQICIEIFDYLKNKDKAEELIKLGKKALSNIKDNLETCSDIALYLAEIDKENEGEHIYEAFSFNPSVLNLLRIANSGYYPKYEKDIKNKIESQVEEKNRNTDEDMENPCLLKFFSGNFEEVYNESIKNKKMLGWSYSISKTLVYLWLLFLNEGNIKTKSFNKILKEVFCDISWNEDEEKFLGDDIEQIWKKWKSNFKLDENIKEKIIKWLDKTIEKRTEAIMDGNYRKSYYKVAMLIVAYDEMLASQNPEEKGNYIERYISKYSRRPAFKNEIGLLI